MKPWITAMLLVLVSAAPAWSAPRTVTLYLDGAIIEEQVTAHAGVAEVRLPPGVQPGSLRIRPFRGTTIDRVTTIPATPERDRESELARLAERKGRLTDRLKALETREDIFRSAAKSQSGKALRKTKNNPEPLLAIRQGTDYALAQLEEVYRLQRKARKELSEIEGRVSTLEKDPGAHGSIARISFTGKGKGKGGTLSYVRTDLAWTPRYDFRLNAAGSIDVTVRPKLPSMASGTAVAVACARLADGIPEKLPPAMQLPSGAIRLPVERAVYLGGPGSSLNFVISNTGILPLPPGEAACYWQEEYLGTVAFPGIKPGESCEVTVGNPGRPGQSPTP